MNVLTVVKITKLYGDKQLFHEVSLGLNEGDKVGLIGINGTGKTTLLKIIAGEEESDKGTVTKGNGITIAYLPQNPEFDPDCSILAYVMKDKKKSEEHWELESEAKTILTRLGITDFGQRMDHLSGGQKKRIALARTLLAPADILILDEPTNHIDSDMADWLEEYLNKFRGVLFMVTHDRYFLDRVTNRIMEIDQGNLYAYDTNYSGFIKLKAEREEMEVATERKRQSILRTELEWMMRGARARSTKQKARIERFEDLKGQRGVKEEQRVEMDSVGTRLGRKTIEINDICKAYGSHILVDHYSYIVLRDERIGIIGPNGCGKSTLIKMITGIVEPDRGTIELGETIRIGYFSQENQEMEDKEIRVIDYIRNVAEIIETSRGSATASQMLERFLFPPALQYTPLNLLSGGEKRRLYLLQVLMSAPNVLILDEPTNDLDIATLTILEDYLDSFQGIVIAVSHDRYFLDRVVQRIFAFEENGKIQQYEGGFGDYLEAHKFRTGEGQELAVKEEKTAYKPKSTKLKFTYMEQKEYNTIDGDIANLETKIEDLEQEIAACATQYDKLSKRMKQKETLEQELEAKMDRWVYLNDFAEKIANQ